MKQATCPTCRPAHPSAHSPARLSAHLPVRPLTRPPAHSPSRRSARAPTRLPVRSEPSSTKICNGACKKSAANNGMCFALREG